jgi:D-arabinose 1-dehydrogenase-like Zn-dependent alcohol dehydrogenase
MTSYETTALGKTSKAGNFEKFSIGRVRTSDFDVDIDVKYCGLCHTDLHLVPKSFFKNKKKCFCPTLSYL